MTYDLILACVLLIMAIAGFLAGWWLRGAWFPPRKPESMPEADASWPLVAVHIEVLGRTVKSDMVIHMGELEKLAGALGRYTLPIPAARN